MKRFYNYFLSLFLLSIAGITSAVAQGFTQGDLLTSMDDIVGKQVLIFANGGITSDAPSGFLRGSKSLTETASTKDCLFTFEATGKTTTNGNHPTYRLKQVATGLYLKDVSPLSSEDDETSDVEWVADVNQAYEFTSLEAVALEADAEGHYTTDADEESVRTQATPAKQNLDETSFIFARAELASTAPGEYYRTFLGHVTAPFWSPYVDTNAWNIFAVENLTGKEKLQSYADAFYQNAPVDEFPTGTAPGQYDEALVNAAQAVYEEVQKQLGEEFTLDDAGVDALCAQIESTYNAAKASVKSLTDGTYFIHDSRATQCYLYGQKSGSKYVASVTSGYSVPDPYDTTVPQYVWQVTSVGKDTITLKNIVAEQYFQATSKTLSGHYDLGDAEIKLAVRKPTDGASGFWLTPVGTSQIICSNPDGRVLSWTEATDSGNHWQFESADASKLADLIAQAKQEALNSNLASAVATAKAKYAEGVYMSEVAGGADFTAEGALIEATGDEDNSNFWCNHKQDDEGTYEALLDNDFSTYFHSSWSGNLGTEENPHFLVANLKEAVSGQIEIKMAARDRARTGMASNGQSIFPTLITVYGANEFDKENPDATEWKKQGQVSVTWNITAEGFTQNTTNNVGYAIATLDGSYKYIRFDVNRVGDGHCKYFAISECNIWPATDSKETYSPEFEELQKSNPIVITNLLAEIKASEAQLATGKATQEQIDAMKAAYQTFLDNYPDPSLVTTARNNAQAILDAASDNIGEELAQYPQEAADALQAVIDEYTDFAEVSLSAINAAVKAINDAVTTFQSTVRLPEAGKFYTLRSASKKQGGGASGSGYDGVLYRALVYSASNAIDAKNGTKRNNTGALNFYRLDGSSDVAEDADESAYSELQDSVSVSDDARTIWKAEKSENGTIVLRNVGTGMYLAPQNGWIMQSTEPFAIPVEGVAAKTFVFNAGKDEDGTTWYMNTMGAYNRVVSWKGKDDENSKWFIEEINADEVSGANLVMQNDVKADTYYIGTFPYAISVSDGDLNAAYKVVGISENDGERKLVLAQYEDVVPAATPFIYKFTATSHNGGSETGVGMAKLAIATDDMANFSDYVFTPQTANGLVGTITANDTISGGTAYFLNGELKGVKGDATYVIGANKGYLVDSPYTTEMGDVTIDLGNLLNALTGKAKLQYYAAIYYKQAPTEEFPVGNATGKYDAKLVAVAQTVYVRVQQLLQGTTYTLDDAATDELCKQIVSTYNAAKASYKTLAFTQGDLLTSMDDIVGKQVLIFANGGITSDAPSGFLRGSKSLTETASTKDCLFTFEATGKTTTNGNHPTYRLKQVATGLYLKDVSPLSSEDDETSDVEWVADVNQAYEFTSLEAVALEADAEGHYTTDADEESVRTQATPAKQNLDETSFIFARAELASTAPGEYYRTFLGHTSGPFWSPYVDTNAWNIFATEKLTGKDALQFYADVFYQTAPVDEFPVGTAPGQYDDKLVAAAQAVYEEVQKQLGEEFTLNNAGVDALCAQIESTYNAAKASVKSLTDGTYFIHDSRATQCYLYGQKSGSKYVASVTSGYSVPDPYDTTVPQYVWQVTSVGKDTITLKNIVAEQYFQATSKTLSGHYDLGDAEIKLAVRKPTDGASGFWLTPVGTSQIICSNPDGRVLSWTEATDSGNHWQFESADASKLADLIAQAKQEALNSNLASAVATAKAKYAEGVYMSEVAGGADFTAEGALIEATGDEDNSNFWCNHKQDDEGTYEALLDNDFSTYFHSSWSGNLGTEENPHFLVANLKEAVSGQIEIKMAVRDQSNQAYYPTLITVYGANEFDKENPDATEWKKQGQVNVTYNLTAEGFTQRTTNNVGYAIATLDGSYKYIRFDVDNTALNTNKFFVLSECNIWPATGSKETYSPEFEELQKSNPTAITNLLAEIKASEAQLAAGKATQEQIDAMKAAYQTFLDNYPDPSLVTTARNNAQAILDAASDNIGEELAQYPQEAADALQAVIDEYTDFAEVSLSAINAAVKAINDAVTTFQSTVRLPEAGKFYTLRSASKKQGGGASGSGYDGVLYRALVYSASNAIDAKNGTKRNNTGALNFYRLDGSSDVAEDADESAYSELQDSVSVSDDARTIWKAEKSENGTIVLRNVGTGMYLAPQNGWIMQSTEPFAIPVEGVAAKTFVFNAGKDEDGTTWYMNTMGAYNRVVSWKGKDDENSKWFIEEINADEVSGANLVMQNDVKADTYYIGTFPYAISVSDGDLNAAYKVVGISENDGERKLVLAQYEDVVPAATPFIYKFTATSHNGGSETGVGMAQFAVATDDMANFSDYVFTPQAANGLVGTITANDTISGGTAYFLNGELKEIAPNSYNTHIIGANSGYIVGCPTTKAEGDATIDVRYLEPTIPTEISEDNVVVLPSLVDVYSVNGALIRKGVKSTEATKGLSTGFYIVGGVKVLVK